MKRRKGKKSFFLRLLIFFFCIYVSISMVQLQMDISDRKKELNDINNQIQLQIEQNTVYQHQIDVEDSIEFLEHTAKEKLGYGYPDERVYFDVSGN